MSGIFAQAGLQYSCYESPVPAHLPGCKCYRQLPAEDGAQEQRAFLLGQPTLRRRLVWCACTGSRHCCRSAAAPAAPMRSRLCRARALPHPPLDPAIVQASWRLVSVATRIPGPPSIRLTAPSRLPPHQNRTWGTVPYTELKADKLKGASAAWGSGTAGATVRGAREQQVQVQEVRQLVSGEEGECHA